MKARNLSILAAVLVLSSACSSWGAGPGHGCFRFGTLIDGPNGPRPIQTLQPGDEVYSFDEASQSVVVGQVTGLKAAHAEEIGRLELEDGRVVWVTRDHPIYLPERGEWVEAGALSPGTALAGVGADRTLEPTKVLSLEFLATDETVFNLKVRDHQNSFAGGILAHFY